MTIGTTIDFLAAAQTVLYAVLILKLWRDKLVSKYRFFATYLVVSEVLGILVVALPRHTDVYAYFYFFSQPFHIIVTFMAISEVYGLVLKNLPGIEGFGKKVVLPASVVISVLLSGATLFFGWTGGHGKPGFLDSYLTIEQFLYGSILLVVLLISAFLAFLPLPLSKNAVLHSTTFAVYVLSHTVARMLVLALGTTATAVGNAFILSVAVISLVLWLFRLTPKGEEIPMKSGLAHYTREHELRILSQLDAINSTLQNSVKK